MTTNIYILKLESGKYYVGKSDNVISRFEQHLLGNGSAWTKKYKALSIEKTIENVSPFEEDKVTKEYMAKYGIENVRGGSYVGIDISEEQEGLLRSEIRGAKDCCHKCGKDGHFANQCKRKSSFTGSCGCGKTFLDFNEFMSHNRMCISRYQKQKEKEKEKEEEEEFGCDYCDRTFTTEFGCKVHERSCKEKNKKTKQTTSKKKDGVCFRCGRPGHYSPDCYARTHKDGYELD